MLETIDLEDAAGKTIKKVVRHGNHAVIIVYTDGTCTGLEADDENGNDTDLNTDRSVNPLYIDRHIVEAAFGVELAEQLITEAMAAHEAAIAEDRRRAAEREAEKEAAIMKAKGFVPVAIAQTMLDALELVVNTSPAPGEDAELTADSYNAACAAIAQAEAALKSE